MGEGLLLSSPYNPELSYPTLLSISYCKPLMVDKEN